MNIVNFILDALFFLTLALTLVYIIDIFIRIPSPNEPFYITVITLYIQIIIGMIVLYCIDFIFEKINNRPSTSYFGITVFGVLFFMTQQQLLKRVSIIYHHVRDVLPIKEFVL